MVMQTPEATRDPMSQRLSLVRACDLSVVFVPVLLFLLGACGTSATSVREQPPSEETAPPAAAVAPAAVHAATGFVFPPEVAGFRWESENTYDGAGLDASQQYTNIDGVLITFYVYPANDRWDGVEDILAREFVEVTQAMEMYHSQYQILDERIYELYQEHQYSIGYHILAQGDRLWDEELVSVQTAMYLFQHGSWFVKLRASYPQELGSQGLYAVERFLEELPWPYFGEMGV